MATAPDAETVPVVPNRATSAGAPREVARAAPLTYAAVAICFFFTFLNVSCQGQRVVSLSGLQLAFGTTIETRTMFGGTEKKKVSPEPIVAGALIAALTGLIFSIRKSGRRKISTVAGVVGFLLLLAYKSKTDGDVLRQGGGMIQVDYGGGFILAVALFAVAILLASGLADRTVSMQGP